MAESTDTFQNFLCSSTYTMSTKSLNLIGLILNHHPHFIHTPISRHGAESQGRGVAPSKAGAEQELACGEGGPAPLSGFGGLGGGLHSPQPSLMWEELQLWGMAGGGAGPTSLGGRSPSQTPRQLG